MPDTIYYNPGSPNPAIDTLPPETRQLILQTLQGDTPVRRKGYTKQGLYNFLFGLGVLLFIAFIIVKLLRLKRADWQQLNNNNGKAGQPSSGSTAIAGNTKEDTNDEYYIYDGSALGLSRQDIEEVLIKRYPFYSKLWPTMQYRFMQRLVAFMQSKSFIIYSQQPYKEMPVLTSAAAIQLTFGLDDFMLSWYTHIAVHPAAYLTKDSLRILAGNVDGKIITLAWDELLKGINNSTDGSNVGLHEMAHALYYQHAEADDNRQVNFSSHFEKVIQQGEEIYKLKKGTPLLYTNYAYRNLQEFWAESVELFFEKPNEMMAQHPDIYNNIKALLKQDPTIAGNPVSS